MFCRKTSLAIYAFLCVKFCAENGAGVKIWQIWSMVVLSKEDSGLAMGRRVHMFGRTISSLGIVSGAHWENCAELKRFGIFRRIGRNAPEKWDARHHCHRRKVFCTSSTFSHRNLTTFDSISSFWRKESYEKNFLGDFLHAKNLMLGEGSLRKVWRNN